MSLKNKKILIYIGRGISAYKSLDLIRLLRDSPTQVMLENEHDEGSKPTNVREQLSAD